MFGMDGSLWTQYKRYVGQLLKGNLGLSMAFFPTPVEQLIARALPWTLGLLSVTVLFSWIIGNALGALVGWFDKSKVNSIIASLSLVVSRIPYYMTFGQMKLMANLKLTIVHRKAECAALRILNFHSVQPFHTFQRHLH